jgi:hypothetical protein
MFKRLSVRVLLMLVAWLWLAVLQPASGSQLGGTHHSDSEPALEAPADPRPLNATALAHVHNHMHDEPVAGQGAGVHSHGHSPVDHLQDIPLLPGASQAFVAHAIRWTVLDRFALASAPLYALERPPKRQLA